jgi:hypothetical protein
MLKSLSEQYAHRARELSDAVALLGRHDHIGPELLVLLKRIRQLRELCGDAERKFERYVEQEDSNSRGEGAA